MVGDSCIAIWDLGFGIGMCDAGGGRSLDLAQGGGGGVSSYSSWVCTYDTWTIYRSGCLELGVHDGRFSTRCVEDSCIAAGCG